MSMSGRAQTAEAADKIHLIAIMGVTGSGKSQFLRLIMGENGIEGPTVGHGLESCKSPFGISHPVGNQYTRPDLT